MSQTVSQTFLDIPANGVAGTVPGQAYTLYSYAYTATAAETWLAFNFREDAYFWDLDDVDVTTGTGANLLTDGGFESGLTGWISTGDGAVSTSVGVTPRAPHTGTHYYVNGTTSTLGGLYQSFATTVGTVYTVSFYLANDYSILANPNLVVVQAGSTGATPTLSPASDSGTYNNDDITNVTTPVITGTGTAGDTINLFNAGTLVGTGSVAGGGTWSITTTTLVNGTASLTEIETNSTGLAIVVANPLAVTIDTVASAAPTGLTLSVASDSGTQGDDITDDTTPVITGSATAGDIVTLYAGTLALGSATVAVGGTWSITSSVLTDGTYSLTTTDTDLAGNVSSASAALPLTIAAAPAAPTGLTLDPASDSGTPGDGITNVTTPTIDGSATAGDTVTLYNGSTLLGSATIANNGSWSITSSALADGTYSLSAHDNNYIGYSPDSAPLSLVINTADAPTGLALSVGTTTANALQPTLSGTADAGDSVTVEVGGSAVGTVTADGQGHWSYQFASDLPDGLDHISAVATNSAGSVSTPSGSLDIVINGTLDWATAVGGDFSTAGNWLYQGAATDAVPNATDVAVFATGAGVAYTVTGNGTAAQVLVATDPVTFTGTITTPNSSARGGWSVNVNAGGTLSLGADGLSAAFLLLDGGTVQAPKGGLTVTAGVTLTGGTTSTLLGVSSGTLTLSGEIDGAGGLLLSGGAIALTDTANSFSGGTTLSGATLVVPDSGALGSGPLATAAGTSNTLVLGSGSYSISSGGTDTINAGSGAVSVTGGAGRMTFTGAAGPATVYGGTGGGLLIGGSGSNLLVAGGGNTTLIGGSGSNTLVSQPGDVAFGGAGNATIFGAAAGGDVLVGGIAQSTLIATGGSEQLWAGTGPSTLYGSPGSAVLGGNPTGTSTMVGGTGANTFVGNGGTATMFLGSGTNLVFTGPGTTTVVEGADSGTIEFGSGPATVWGGAGTSIDMFTQGAAGGADVLAGYQPGRDQIDLFGYTPSAVGSQSAGGDTVLTLGDGTTVRMVGVASLPVSALHFGP